MTSTDFTKYLGRWVTYNTEPDSPYYGQYVTHRNTARTEESMYHDLWELMTREHEARYPPSGAERSNMEDVIYELLKTYEVNKNGTTFVPVRNSKPPELPDNYPKGDLDDLLGLNAEDD